MRINSSFSKVQWAIIVLLAVMSVGVLGFMYFEDYSFLNAVYLTTITITTVGYGLPRELSNAGKIFTVFLILLSFVNYAYAISIITTYLVEGQLRRVFGRHSKSLKKYMKEHVIICGLGRNGRQVVKEMQAHHQPFVVIDNNAELMNTLTDNIPFVVGDATDDNVLEQAGILQAKAIVSTMPNDADNLFVALSARALNPSITIVSRASSAASEKKMYIAGVNHVVLPENVGGSHMAKLATRKDVAEFLDHLSVTGESETNLEEVYYDELPTAFKDKTIKEMSIRQLIGANIVGYKSCDGKFIINPPPSTKIEKGSTIFMLCTAAQISKIKKL